MRDNSTGSIRSPWTPRETSTPAQWKTANGFRSLFPLSEKEGRSATMGGWPRLTFFFPLDGDHQREDSTALIHRTDKNRGCPTRRVYAWGGSCILPSPSIRSAEKTGNDEIKSPTR